MSGRGGGPLDPVRPALPDWVDEGSAGPGRREIARRNSGDRLPAGARGDRAGTGRRLLGAGARRATDEIGQPAQSLVRQRHSREVGVGIGVNSGRVVSGTVGGGGRVEFTVIGDTVNTAARVERATRETGDDVLITESTRERLCKDVFDFEERPPVPPKGKSVQVRLWAPRAAIRESTGSLAARAPVSD